MFRRLAELFDAHRAKLALAVGLATIAAIFGLSRLQFDDIPRLTFRSHDAEFTLLEEVFRQAGFADPETFAVPVPHAAASAAEYVRVAREAFGGFNAMMAHLSAEDREAVWDEVAVALRSFESQDGFEVPGECLVGAATK